LKEQSMTVETPPVVEETPPAPPAPPADPPLGDAGQAALKAERERADKAEKALKAREAADEKARIAALDDNARAIEEAKAAAKAEAATEYEAKIMGLRVAARAAGDFVDTELVTSLVTLPTDATDDEIDKALLKVAQEKPYLVKPQHGVPPMPQGPRGNGPSTADGITQGDKMLREMFDANQARKG
jgi:hypothetical protein